MGRTGRTTFLISNRRSTFEHSSLAIRHSRYRCCASLLVRFFSVFEELADHLEWCDLDRLEEKGSAPNTYGQTRGLGLRYRDEAVRYLRAAQNVPEEMASDVFLSACMMVSHADVSHRF